jgi:hypothetical protein
MKFATIYRPKYPPPPEQIPALLEEMGAWMQRYGARFETLSFFVGGGGFGTIDSDDAGELTRIIAENPFTPFSEIETRPVLEPAAALGILQEAYSKAGASA